MSDSLKKRAAKQQTKKKKILNGIGRIALILFIIYTLANTVYMLTSYHADETAKAALQSDDTVVITKTDYGYFFDGPSEREALIFYQGAKVDASAYAPILHEIATEGMDVLLVDMPYDLAIIKPNKADNVISQYSYENRYIGGHSLGGCMAAYCASDHADKFEGVILLAAYPAKAMGDDIRCISIYGSEDGILNWSKMAKAERYLPKDTEKHVLAGGNHGQFGNYGKQHGDRNATITASEQQKQTVELIMDWVRKR